MKQLLKLSLVLLVFVALSSCGSRQSGQLIGVTNRPAWKGINPYGMQYVPSGTLHIGAGDQDIANTFVQRPRSISIVGFYMDDTEVTNNEYRQFVYWVRDSIAHSYLEHYVENEEGDERIDWEMDIDWELDAESLEDMFYQGDDKFAGKREYDVEKFQYEYEWYDWKRAAHDKGNTPRNAFIQRKEVNIYPDTLVWIRDFSYSYNEPMTRNYFWHPAYDDYPTVGVDWYMSNAFCYWRTNLWNRYESADGSVNSEDFRLPFESEWEYAARGGHEGNPYPWGAYYLRNAKGCLLANFKPGRGNYPEDGGLYTVKADAYFPNDYGLFNMSGNVAEWTNTAYFENAYSFAHDLNPDIRYDAQDDDPEAYKRKVIRGGSWKDIGYFLQNQTRHWEYQDTTKSYIGFRCALTFLGRSVGEF